ncbi:MAG: hypothetical protein FJ126_10570 [Deltaproteobacteria bacterium]|nr:hypothetical protein [Deltaproteobacteria bacterium]
MVGHQAIGPNLQAISLGLFTQPGKILHPVSVLKENVLPVIAPLGDLMGRKGKNDPGLAAHNGANVSKFAALARKIRVCPYFLTIFLSPTLHPPGLPFGGAAH